MTGETGDDPSKQNDLDEILVVRRHPGLVMSFSVSLLNLKQQIMDLLGAKLDLL